MKSFKCIVQDFKGLDAKTAMQLARKAQEYSSVIIVICAEKKANVRNVMELVGLKAEAGEELIFAIDGEDEEQAETGLKAVCQRCLQPDSL
ncbi:MAG: HPr family phosphocarrier protein [Eubacteriales bacterium]|nr:HPr family phosphocarrier protein [Eubacteriales bacterium]